MKYANWNNELGNPEWFLHDRFGMFIHFGLFSLAARHEWLMTTEQISPEDYQKYFEHFNPELIDMKTLAKTAKETGMKYAVLTTKHHEGFALWDTDYSDYKITNTQFKRDLVQEFIEAFRAEGIKIGLYHSLIDWHHEDFTIDGLHPQRDDEEYRKSNNTRKMEAYLDYLKNQVTELLTNYGKVDYFWFDFSYGHRDWEWSKGKGKNEWKSEEILDLVTKLQPDILVNDRLDLGLGVVTPEQYQPEKPLVKDGQPVIWEACQAMKPTWGYDRDAKDWKSSEVLLKMLIETVSNNGNFLLNVGPNAKGELDKREESRLNDIGDWMKRNSKSLYGAGQSPFTVPKDCRYTQVGSNKLYLHIYSWPLRHIHLQGLAGRVQYAQFLHDHSQVFFREFDPEEVITSTETHIDEDSVVLELPIEKPEVLVPVVEIFLKDGENEIKI
ncbi:alpha-L-fucosidase [Desemzia sp. RIT804]|uniref:alpha-L-fucosidase n=1 Tax=Desemzia sp. RIT 804 TaxID=2810209 RepID=UPI00194F559B|nr:alpha-L-fucosidase [Desemzia sp. RIT 804]MBM6615450.1 alpha-L-fucosidase [Desemzia sp. RIT 804]